MKVNFTPITQILNKVTDKDNNKQGGAGQNAYERQKKDEKKEEVPVTAEEVQSAIETFSGDETNLSHGITAKAEGNGPGLKVVLRDGSGGVLRSVSGEEFLKLREAVTQGKKSGRIIDQKA